MSPFPVAGGDVITAADVNSILPDALAYVAYTPALTATTTSPTLGTGSTQIGRSYRFGKLVVVHIAIRFGTSNAAAGTGEYRVSVPRSIGSVVVSNAMRIGGGLIYDASTAVGYSVVAHAVTATTVGLRSHGATSNVGAAVPFTWAVNDQIELTLTYEAA